MTRTLRRHRTTRHLATSAAATVLALGIGACSNNGDPESTNSSSATSQSSRDSSDDDDAPGTDQSDALFEAYSEPKPVGKATDGDQTFEVFEVDSGTGGTRLTFHITSETVGFPGLDPRDWNEYPQLVDRSGKTAYQPLTVTQPEYENSGERSICICTGQDIAHNPPRAQQVLYQSLPKNVTSVDVSYGDFDPITVKVTR